MKGQQLVVISSPGLSAGFALAGVPVFEATDGADAARQIDHLPDAMNVGVILIDEPLYEDLPEEVRRDLRRAPVPVVIPVPGPDWTTETTAHEYIVEILRRALSAPLAQIGEIMSWSLNALTNYRSRGKGITIVRNGRYGTFVSCNRCSKCEYTESQRQRQYRWQ